MKSFKQYLKEYASAVRNEEDDTEDDDRELTDALSRSGEGGQALRNAMQQGGLLRLKTRLYPEDEQGSYEDIRDRVARGIASSEDLREFDNLLIKRAKLDSSFDPPSETDQEPNNIQNDPRFVEKRKVPSETDNTKGKDQEMLDTIAGRGDSLDHPNQRDAGSALLSAMRAGGMTFDAKWPSNVDRYDNREKDAGRMRPVSTERR